jgi:hypothetical protein
VLQHHTCNVCPLSASLSNFSFFKLKYKKNIGLLVLMEIVRFIVVANRRKVKILTVGYSKEHV